MATPYTISLGREDEGNFYHGGYNAAASAKASELLQKNIENWNIHFSGLRHGQCYVVCPLLCMGHKCFELY